MPNGELSARPERLSRADSARWHMATPENPMVIGAVLLFDQRLALETVEELVRSKLVPHRRFRQHAAEARHRFGRPRWHDDSAFDLARARPEARIRPNPIDAAALVGLASEGMSAPLPRDRSPWTFDLVDLVPGGSALLVRIHHCMADGQALVALLEELADEAPHEEEATAHRPPPSRRSHRRRGLFGQLAGLFRFLTLSGDPESALRRPLGGHKRVAWSEAISLDAVKSIARARGHHVTEVLLAAVAGALDRTMRDQGPGAAIRPRTFPGRAAVEVIGRRGWKSLRLGVRATADRGRRSASTARSHRARHGGVAYMG